MKPTNIGIKGIELYVPNQCVEHTELEKFDGAPHGKYTTGLGRSRICFTDDREDIYSMALTAVHSLMLKYNIDPKSIGRLEVGTNTVLDKSKSVKSVLMQLFEPRNTNIEGVDTVGAGYEGSNALFNSVNWIESSSWDGTNAIVVTGDVALYHKGNARFADGAGCVAMLIGPHAPIVLEEGLRGSYMRHVYDSCKPDLKVEPLEADGPLSLNFYAEALDHSYRAFLERQAALSHKGSTRHCPGANDGQRSLPADQFDYMCLHAPNCKLVQKSYSRMFYYDYTQDPANLLFKDIPTKYRNMDYEASLVDQSLEHTFTTFAKQRIEKRLLPALYVPEECGNMYTASLYSALCGLLASIGSDELQEKRIGMFSSGSGLASTLFSLRVIASTEEIRQKLHLESKLSGRRLASPRVYVQMCSLRERAHVQKSYQPVGLVENLREGTYYLSDIDHASRRSYRIKTAEAPQVQDSGIATPIVNMDTHLETDKASRGESMKEDESAPNPPILIVSNIEAPSGAIRVLKFCRPGEKNAISRQLLLELAEQIGLLHAEGGKGPTRTLILSSAVDNVFCAGADLKERARMTEEETKTFLLHLRNTLTKLEALPIPSIACVSGIALGGGLEIALCCHLRIFAANAVVGMPETRLAIIPGAGGTYRLPSLIGLSNATDMVFTGRQVTAVEALRMGLCNRLIGRDQGGDPGSHRRAALEVALSTAKDIASGGPIAIRAAVRAFKNPSEETEAMCYEEVLSTRDRHEALQAFRERRKPIFMGR